MTRLLLRALMAPAVAVLLCWMLVPLLMTVYFSFVDYNLMQPGGHPFVGLRNYEFFVTDPDFMPAVRQTLVFLASVVSSPWCWACCWRCWSTSHFRAAAWCACC